MNDTSFASRHFWKAFAILSLGLACFVALELRDVWKAAHPAVATTRHLGDGSRVFTAADDRVLSSPKFKDGTTRIFLKGAVAKIVTGRLIESDDFMVRMLAHDGVKLQAVMVPWENISYINTQEPD